MNMINRSFVNVETYLLKISTY